VTKIPGPVRRVDTAKRPYWKDANGARVPGVTSLTGDGLPKKNLIDWSANATAAYAVDHWDELSELPPSKRLERLKKGRYEETDAAKDRGIEVHNAAALLAQGEEVDVPNMLTGHVESYVQFLDEFEPEPILIEVFTVSYKHGYIAILDSVFYFPSLKKKLLCDIKTNKSGIFGETALQLAGARYADVYIDENGKEQPMIEVDGCAGIHVTENGYKLVPITAGPRQFRQLLYVAEVREFDLESRDLVGAPVVPPSRLTRRRLEVVSNLEEVAS
jgi:hypothetical protein